MRRRPTRRPGPRTRTRSPNGGEGPKLSRAFLDRFGGRPDRRQEDEGGGGTSGSPVVVGLGNPGRSYERTRHNAGYLVLEELAKRHGGSWRSKKKAEAAPVGLGLKNVTLLKPTTYMNNSGSALAGYRVEDLIVVHDDLDLPPGDVRVKIGGGAGGHNGLRSIINNFGNDFVRVRVGIGRPPEGARITVTDYVLGRMDSAVKEAIPAAADAVEAVVENGPEWAMNRFNVRPRTDPPPP
jgi:peptidyl-tRNA hydrolase, PTH1 family